MMEAVSSSSGMGVGPTQEAEPKKKRVRRHHRHHAHEEAEPTVLSDGVRMTEGRDEWWSVSGVPEKSVSLDTSYGPVTVTIQGEVGRPAIITYPDIGLNHETCFNGFLNHPDAKEMFFPYFCLYHIDPPGLERDAPVWGDDRNYPDIDGLVGQIATVIRHYKLVNVIGMGVGAGGHLLTRFAAANTDLMIGIISFGATTKAPGPMENMYQLGSQMWLRWFGMSPYVRSQLIARWFGPETVQNNPELIESYKKELDHVQPANLVKFIRAFMTRTPITDEVKSARCEYLLFSGRDTYYEEDVDDMKVAVTSTKAARLNLRHVGMLAHVEDPGAVVNPIRLFFAGLRHFIQYDELFEQRIAATPEM